MKVQYKDQELDLKSGDVILFRTGFKWYKPITYLSAAIRFFTKVDWNHAGVVVSNWRNLFINEALAAGVQAKPLKLDRGGKIMVLRPKSRITEAEFCTRANSKLGIPYDYWDLVVNQLWFRLTGRWIGHTREFAMKKGMVCTEYAAWCHGLDKWWTYSAAEFLKDDSFKVVYQEQ